jgi:hypothetical protein
VLGEKKEQGLRRPNLSGVSSTEAAGGILKQLLDVQRLCAARLEETSALMSWPAIRSDSDVLRALVIAVGLCWSVAFVAIALRYELALYADGAMFSYAVAVQDLWAFHWHNISGRLSVFLLSLLPAEIYVGLSGNPGAGIVVYGLLFYLAPLAGLIGTFAADRSLAASSSSTPVLRQPCSARWSLAFRPRCGWRTRCSGRRSPSAIMRNEPSLRRHSFSSWCSHSRSRMKARWSWHSP